MEQRVELTAYAKVNLGLDIVGRREDGYHLVRMIMQSVGLFDRLTFERKEDPGIELLVSEASTLPDLADMPTDDRNLIVRGARSVMEKYGIEEGLRITLEKHIPMAAGMAGGSTDCAAALKGTAQLFETGSTPEELAELGVRLGADVPYCLLGGTALSEGIGEVLTPLTPLPEFRFLIVKPSFGVSTKEVYTAYDSLAEREAAGSGGGIPHPDIDGMVTALSEGDPEGIMSRLGNVLEYVTVERHPEILRIEELVKEAGAAAAIMTGSGPTVFGMLPGREGPEPDTEALRRKLAEAGITAEVYMTGCGA